jgi:hypothetical protein
LSYSLRLAHLIFALRKTPAPELEICEALQSHRVFKMLPQKYSSFVFPKIMICCTHSAAGERGVSRSSRHVVRNAVDVDVPTDERRERGWRSGVVLARPCRRQVLRIDGAQNDGGKRWFTGESAYKP